MKKNKISFIKADLRAYRKTCNRDIECIALTKVGMGSRFKNTAFEWRGETSDEYFFIRYLAGILNVGIADNEMAAENKYAPMGFLNDVCECAVIELEVHTDPDLIKHICKFLKWKLPPGGVDDLSFN